MGVLLKKVLVLDYMKVGGWSWGGCGFYFWSIEFYYFILKIVLISVLFIIFAVWKQ